MFASLRIYLVVESVSVSSSSVFESGGKRSAIYGYCAAPLVSARVGGVNKLLFHSREHSVRDPRANQMSWPNPATFISQTFQLYPCSARFGSKASVSSVFCSCCCCQNAWWRESRILKLMLFCKKENLYISHMNAKTKRKDADRSIKIIRKHWRHYGIERLIPNDIRTQQYVIRIQNLLERKCAYMLLCKSLGNLRTLQ